MFGFVDEDCIQVWLKGRREGQEMNIDCPHVKNMLIEAIEKTRISSENRIRELEALLKDARYFKQ
jgi:hypothetical protein